MSANKTIKNIIVSAVVCALGFGCAAAMTGCDTVKDAISSTSIGQKATSSRSTDSSDREDCWKTLQDINGNEYTTVIWLDPMEGKTEVDVEAIKKVLNDNNVNWYQIITSDNKKAPGKSEHGLIYMPASVTLSDMTNVANIAGGIYGAHVMTREEYETYLENAPSDNIMEGINIYERETTEFGPAAQANPRN